MSTQEELMENYDNLDLEKLPEKFHHEEDDFKLIKRTNAKCFYARIWNGDIIGYEVFKTKILPFKKKLEKLSKYKKQSFDSTKYKDYKEVFPSAEEFGSRHWSFKYYLDASNKFDEI